MNLPTIEMPKEEARRHFESYRREVRRRHDDEDAAIAKGYKALADGTPLIRLSEAMKLGGVAVKKMRNRADLTVPRLAVARADSRYAWTNGVGRDGSLTIAGKRELSPLNRRDLVSFAPGSFSMLAGTEPGWGWRSTLNALVPKIPPPLRPKFKLGNYHLIWEADWRVAPGPPPGDPALLRHVGGDLYAVLAVWDLTPLEQAVLAGRSFD